MKELTRRNWHCNCNWYYKYNWYYNCNYNLEFYEETLISQTSYFGIMIQGLDAPSYGEFLVVVNFSNVLLKQGKCHTYGLCRNPNFATVAILKLNLGAEDSHFL
jgi:hypothetical protein